MVVFGPELRQAGAPLGRLPQYGLRLMIKYRCPLDRASSLVRKRGIQQPPPREVTEPLFNERRQVFRMKALGAVCFNVAYAARLWEMVAKFTVLGCIL